MKYTLLHKTIFEKNFKSHSFKTMDSLNSMLNHLNKFYCGYLEFKIINGLIISC